MNLHTHQTLEGNHTLIITATGLPLAIFCAVSSIVIAAGYARPLTADINGVMPLASLGKNPPGKLKHTDFFFFVTTGQVGSKYLKT